MNNQVANASSYTFGAGGSLMASETQIRAVRGTIYYVLSLMQMNAKADANRVLWEIIGRDQNTTFEIIINENVTALRCPFTVLIFLDSIDNYK